MSEMGFWLRIILAVFATWRVTHLLAREDGPADLIVRLRLRLGDRFAGKLMDCFQCLSLWVALPVAFLVTRRPLELVITWLGLSGAACLLERIGEQPVIMQPISETVKGDTAFGMLRTETSEYQDQFVTDHDASRH